MVTGKVKFFHDKKGWGFIERDAAQDEHDVRLGERASTRGGRLFGVHGR